MQASPLICVGALWSSAWVVRVGVGVSVSGLIWVLAAVLLRRHDVGWAVGSWPLDLQRRSIRCGVRMGDRGVVGAGHVRVHRVMSRTEVITNPPDGLCWG